MASLFFFLCSACPSRSTWVFEVKSQGEEEKRKKERKGKKEEEETGRRVLHFVIPGPRLRSEKRKKGRGGMRSAGEGGEEGERRRRSRNGHRRRSHEDQTAIGKRKMRG